MLYELKSNRSSFKSLKFHKGLNIILADRQAIPDGSEANSDRRTRNGAGKSSIIDLVHFLLAGKPEGALKSQALSEWLFELKLDVGSELMTISRSPKSPKANVQVKVGRSEELLDLSSVALGNRLGQNWFNLSSEKQPGAASFRQLISYFARRRRDGGYDDPVRTFRAQPNAVSETNLAVLFGLSSETVRRFHSAKNALKQNHIAQRALRDIDKAAPAV